MVVGGQFGDVFSRGYQRDDQGRVLVDALGLPLVTPGIGDVLVSNFNPDWLGGIRNSFRYKNWNFSSLIDIRQGGSIISFTEAILASDGVLQSTVQGRGGTLVFGQNIFGGETAVSQADGSANNINVTAEDFWNRVGGRNTPVGEAFKKDASNIRVREIILGYTVPQKLLDKTFLTSASISLVGRNLFFISNSADNVDPESLASVAIAPGSTNNGEISGEGRESFAPPTTRSFGVSINFGF